MVGVGKAFARLPTIAVGVMIVVASLVAFVPLAPGFPAPGLDDSWKFALNVALAKGFVFGRDIVFTFGPYAATYTGQYHPDTDIQMLWSTALIGVAFAAGAICLSRGIERILMLALMVFLALLRRDSLFLAVPYMLLLLAARTSLPADHPARIAATPAVRLTLATLVVALALLPLVKGTFALAVAAAVPLACWPLAATGRKAFIMSGAALFAVALPTMWLLAGQPLPLLPGFFIAQAPIVLGYSEAMSLDGPPSHVTAFLACAALLLTVLGLAYRRAGVAGNVVPAGTAILLFIGFKAGFTRQDSTVLIAAGTLGVMGCLAAPGLPERAGALGLLAGLTGWALIYRPAHGLDPRALLSRAGVAYVQAGEALATRILSPGAMARQYVGRLAAIRVGHGVPAVAGTVDIYSVGQAALLANDPDWAPRPIPQSYSAYTPALARKNADHLLGPSAPANIFFSIEPIDGRLPALDDGPSWPILLSRYDVAGLRGGMAILRRTSPAPSPIAEDRLQEGIFQLGQSIALPTDAPWIWARPDVEPTWLGRIASFVYKPPPLRIAFQFADGHASDFRYIAAIGRAGFLAAPLVVTTRDFVALGLPPDEVSGARPIAMTIFAPAAGQWLGRWFWRSSFSAAFSAIRLPAQPAIARILCPDDAVTPADCPARRDSDTRAAASPAGHARPNPESARR